MTIIICNYLIIIHNNLMLHLFSMLMPFNSTLLAPTRRRYFKATCVTYQPEPPVERPLHSMAIT